MVRSIAGGTLREAKPVAGTITIGPIGALSRIYRLHAANV